MKPTDTPVVWGTSVIALGTQVMAMGPEFGWWHLTEGQQRQLLNVFTGLIVLVGVLIHKRVTPVSKVALTVEQDQGIKKFVSLLPKKIQNVVTPALADDTYIQLDVSDKTQGATGTVKISQLPSLAQDATTKSYVDMQAAPVSDPDHEGMGSNDIPHVG